MVSSTFFSSKNLNCRIYKMSIQIANYYFSGLLWALNYQIPLYQLYPKNPRNHWFRYINIVDLLKYYNFIEDIKSPSVRRDCIVRCFILHML